MCVVPLVLQTHTDTPRNTNTPSVPHVRTRRAVTPRSLNPNTGESSEDMWEKKREETQWRVGKITEGVKLRSKEERNGSV